jgi:uracil phosphoribosyltransferase
MQDETPIGFEYSFEAVDCSKITLVPILRSGLGMVEGKLLHASGFPATDMYSRTKHPS